MAVRPNFFHRTFSQKMKRSWSWAPKKRQGSSPAWVGCQLQMACSSYLSWQSMRVLWKNDRYVNSGILKLFTRQIFEVPRDHTRQVAKKLSEVRKSSHVQRIQTKAAIVVACGSAVRRSVFWGGGGSMYDWYVVSLLSFFIIRSAEALPRLCVRYNRWERERDGSSETEVTSPLSR